MDSIFFYASKVLWEALKPDNVIAILLVLVLIVKSSNWVDWKNYLKFSLAASLLIITIFPVGNWLTLPLEQRFGILAALPGKVDGIVVLSGGMNAKATALLDQVQVNEQADRDFAFIKLARQYPEARLVYSGGSSSLVHQQHKGADVASRFLTEMGLDTGRVIFERDSRNTYESAVLSKKLVNPQKGETWLLVTSAFHIPRSVGAFCQAGWPVIPYPVDFKSDGQWKLSFDPGFADNLQELTLAIKEWIGLLAYWSTGRIPALLPGGCR